MIILDESRDMSVKLEGAPASFQPHWTASYAEVLKEDFTMSAMGSAVGNTSGANSVTMVAAPANTAVRQVKFASVHNRDTVTANVVVTTGGKSLIEASLAPGDSLTYCDGVGWSCLDSQGRQKFLGRVELGSGYTEEYVDLGDVTGTTNVDLDDGNVFLMNLVGNTTITFLNPPAAGRLKPVTLIMTYAGTFSPSFSDTVHYPFSVVPDWTAESGGKDVISVITYDEGATYLVAPSIMDLGAP